MCCLKYEYHDYIEMKKGIPKVGKRITTPEGEGKVVRQNVMEQMLVVALDDGKELEFAVSDLVPEVASMAECHQCDSGQDTDVSRHCRWDDLFRKRGWLSICPRQPDRAGDMEVESTIHRPQLLPDHC